MGNGGHCNTAAHMINDLAKHTVTSDDKQAVVAQRFRFRTLCLNDSASFVTGIANDMGFDQIFSEQVANWAEPGDVVLGISGSGNSKNILKAFEEARKRGMATVALLGYDGGEILRRGLVDFPIVVHSDYIPRIQEVQASAYHVIREQRLGQR